MRAGQDLTTGQDSAPHVNEQLSVWLDDELPAEEVELLAARLVQSPEQRARVARYGLIGGYLRAGRNGHLAGELLALRLGDRVRATLESPDEPKLLANGPGINRWLPYAVAAGVAILAIALIPTLRTADNSLPANRPMASSPVLPAVVTPVSLSPSRMTSYLVYHGEYSGMLSAKFTDSNIINVRASAAPLAGGTPAR